jgi:DtxR family Mn-dependent transcriptional regulator
LTERLLADVLDIHGAEIDRTACELEHIIAREVTDSICTLLGHPRQCPHGSPIPEGECCKAAQSRFEPIVVSLDRLAPGARGRIAYVQTKDHGHLHRLLALGVVPGTEIVLHQKAPSFVISAGQTQVALDEETARRVFVRRD